MLQVCRRVPTAERVSAARVVLASVFGIAGLLCGCGEESTTNAETDGLDGGTGELGQPLPCLVPLQVAWVQTCGVDIFAVNSDSDAGEDSDGGVVSFDPSPSGRLQQFQGTVVEIRPEEVHCGASSIGPGGISGGGDSANFSYVLDDGGLTHLVHVSWSGQDPLFELGEHVVGEHEVLVTLEATIGHLVIRDESGRVRVWASNGGRPPRDLELEFSKGPECGTGSSMTRVRVRGFGEEQVLNPNEGARIGDYFVVSSGAFVHDLQLSNTWLGVVHVP